MENGLIVFDKLKADISVFVEPCTKMAVADKESSTAALDAAKQVKSFIKKVEEARVSMVAPHNERVKQINAYAKQITEPLLNAEKHLKTQLVAFERLLEQERERQRKAAEELRKKAEEEAREQLRRQQEEAETIAMFSDSKEAKKAEIVATATAERTMVDIEKQHKEQEKMIAQTKVSGTRKRWVFEVEDASQIPRGFLTLDEKTVRAAIADGVREIPGIRIFEETSIAI